MKTKQQDAHDRLQAEKAFALRQLRDERRRFATDISQLRGMVEYQRARIAALEIEIETLRLERDDARRKA